MLFSMSRPTIFSPSMSVVGAAPVGEATSWATLDQRAEGPGGRDFEKKLV